MDKSTELRRKLDEAAGGVSPAPGVVDQILQRGQYLRRRRRAMILGASSLVVAAVIAPLALTESPGHPQAVSHPRMQHAPHSENGTMAPYMNFPQPPSPPASLVTAQQGAQAQFARALTAIGATIAGHNARPDIFSDEISAGGDVQLDGRSGNVTVTIYKRSATVVGTGDPCTSFASGPDMKLSMCVKTAEPDGSTTWSYQLASTQDSLITLDAINVRTNDEAVMIEATNYLTVGQPPAAPAQSEAVLSTDQVTAIAGTPAFTFG